MFAPTPLALLAAIIIIGVELPASNVQIPAKLALRL